MDPTEEKKRPVSISILFYEDRKLGRGGFGEVYEGEFEGEKVAVKRIMHGDFGDIETVFLKAISHPNLIKYLTIEDGLDFKTIVMELCAGTLQNVVEKTFKGPDPGPMESLLFQTTLGLDFLHSLKIIHRDVKPQNILISNTRYGPSAVVKLADFGLCKQNRGLTSTFSKSASVIGTLSWAAPESIEGGKKARISFSADVFSLGCVFGYALTGGSHPFGDESFAIPYNIMKGYIEWKNAHLIEHEKIRILIRGMISKEPADRPSLSYVLEGFRLTQWERHWKMMSYCLTTKLNSEFLEALKTCVDEQCNLNLTDEEGRNCVMLMLRHELREHKDEEQLGILQKECLNTLLSDAAIPLVEINHKDKKGRNVLHYLCKYYRGDDITQSVKLLINRGINANETIFFSNATPLRMLVRNYKGTDICDVMQLLIDAGADVNAKDPFFDQNVLLELCKHNSSHPMLKEAIAVLIKGGIDINHVDEDGWNALTRICTEKRDPNTHEVIKLLLENGIDVTAKPNPYCSSRYDALLLLCKYYKGDDLVEIMKTLVENGASINSKNLRGENALHLVCENYRNPKLRDVIQYLIEKGIDVNAKDEKGQDALYYLRNRYIKIDPLELQEREEIINRALKPWP